MTHWMEGDWPDKAELERPEDTAVKQLLRAARQVVNHATIKNEADAQRIGELEQALENVEAFFEPDDPRSNGWVGDDGLP